MDKTNKENDTDDRLLCQGPGLWVNWYRAAENTSLFTLFRYNTVVFLFTFFHLKLIRQFFKIKRLPDSDTNRIKTNWCFILKMNRSLTIC